MAHAPEQAAVVTQSAAERPQTKPSAAERPQTKPSAAERPQTKPSAAERPPTRPSVGASRGMIGLLWFGAVATLAYWVIWFGVDRSWLATADTPSYYTFENAFPVADGWMAVTGALGAIALQRRQASALLWMLLAGSAAVYLAGMDVLFDLQNDIYRAAVAAGGIANVAVELFINVGCLAGGIAIIAFAWRYRGYFLSLE